MKQMQINYYNAIPNCIFYFTEYKQQSKEIDVNEHNIYINGEEKTLNIIYKTAKAIEYIYKMHSDIDFLVRTNLSTVIDFTNLHKKLNSIPKFDIYGGGYLYNLQWISENDGIYDKSLWGLQFYQGTAIILSKDIIESMCNNLTNINYTLVDDVSIGLYVKEYHINALKNLQISNCKFIFSQDNKNNDIIEDAIFYRNSRGNRELDIDNMQIIMNKLLKINE
jgi:hypothetical protein